MFTLISRISDRINGDIQNVRFGVLVYKQLRNKFGHTRIEAGSFEMMYLIDNSGVILCGKEMYIFDGDTLILSRHA